MATEITDQAVSIVPIERRSLTGEVMERIKEYISSNELTPGTMLPYEADLARMLNVGRRVTREAVKALEALGILEVRAGKGIYVSDFNYSGLMSHVSFVFKRDTQSLKHLAEARIVVETGVLDLVIQRMTADDIVALEETISSLESAGSLDEHSKADLDFHRILIDITGNPMLVEFCALLKEFFNELDEVAEGIDKMVDAAQHRALVEALKKRDLVLAKRLLREHILS